MWTGKTTGGAKIIVKTGSYSSIAIETTMIVCVWGDKCHLYLIMIIRQHLLMSGDLELNPGPLGGK